MGHEQEGIRSVLLLTGKRFNPIGAVPFAGITQAGPLTLRRLSTQPLRAL